MGQRIEISIPQADITLRKITAVLEVTPEAAQKWEAMPWSK